MSDRSLRLESVKNLLAAKWIWSYLGSMLVFLVIAMVSQNSFQTFTATVSFASFFIMVGIGQMLVITSGPGNIDLSVPATIALAGSVAMKVMNEVDGNIAWGILAGVALGVVIGAFNFVLIRGIRMPPMIATLSTSFIVKTLTIVFFRGLQIKPPLGLEFFATFKVLQIPLLFLFVLLVAGGFHIALTRSRYGRFLHAVGQNTKAAWLSGIDVTQVKLLTYILCAVLASVAGIFLAAFSGGATIDMGDEYMLNSVAVVVLGGSSIAGGCSNVPGIVGASVLLYLIVNLLNILGLGAGLRYIFTGLIIVAIIFAGGEKIRKR